MNKILKKCSYSAWDSNPGLQNGTEVEDESPRPWSHAVFKKS